MEALPLPTMKRDNVIRDARRASGVTQVELARRLGTTQSAVARLESPAANPRLGTLERALAALDRDLVVATPPRRVDLAQLDRHLAMSPAQRLAALTAARRNVRDLVRVARRTG